MTVPVMSVNQIDYDDSDFENVDDRPKKENFKIKHFKVRQMRSATEEPTKQLKILNTYHVVTCENPTNNRKKFPICRE